MIKLVVTGNCQAQLLEAMFIHASPDVEVIRLEPVFNMNEGRKEAVLQIMNDADYIFAQRTSKNFFLSWLTPASLRSTFGTKCLIWPNIYFDGYFPGTGYIYKTGLGKLQSPLDDYHLAPLIDAHRRGLSPSAAVQEFDRFGAEAGAGFEASFAQLERREQDADITISSLLREQASQKRVVYTPNHPLNDVLAELSSWLAVRAAFGFDIGIAKEMPYRLEGIYIPAFPAIRDTLGLPFDADAPYRGVSISEVAKDRVVLGARREYSLPELVDAYWSIYAIFPP